MWDLGPWPRTLTREWTRGPCNGDFWEIRGPENLPEGLNRMLSNGICLELVSATPRCTEEVGERWAPRQDAVSLHYLLPTTAPRPRHRRTPTQSFVCPESRRHTGAAPPRQLLLRSLARTWDTSSNWPQRGQGLCWQPQQGLMVQRENLKKSRCPWSPSGVWPLGLWDRKDFCFDLESCHYIRGHLKTHDMLDTVLLLLCHSVVCPLCVTPWTVACQAPLSMEFSRQKYWSGLPFPSPGILPYPRITPWSSALQADSLPSEPPGKPIVYMYMI